MIVVERHEDVRRDAILIAHADGSGIDMSHLRDDFLYLALFTKRITIDIHGSLRCV